MLRDFWSKGRSPSALILDGLGGGYLVLCRMRDTWTVPGGLPERRVRNDHSPEASYSERGQGLGTVT